MSASYDAVVIGAGPAGCAAATLLARQGRRVALVDRCLFPRDKVCGEAVSPAAWDVLSEMGADEAVRPLARPLFGMRVTSPRGVSFEGRYDPALAPGFTLERRILDSLLLGCATRSRADLISPATAISVEAYTGRRPDRVRVGLLDRGRRTSIEGRFLVVADGRWSFIARQLGLLGYDPRGGARFAIRIHLEGISDLDLMGEMHVGEGFYCGLAPLSSTRANLSLVVNGEDLKTRREPSLEAFALNRIARLPGLGKRTEGTRVIGSARAIGPLRLRARRRASGRVLLAGDAGGFIDPFTGEGVTVALQSGRAAARAILDAADADRARGPSLTRGYEAFWRRRTQVKFRVNRLLQRLIRSERAAHATATALSASPFAANRLVRYFGGQL